MEDATIVSLYWQRSESAIEETAVIHDHMGWKHSGDFPERMQETYWIA